MSVTPRLRYDWLHISSRTVHPPYAAQEEFPMLGVRHSSARTLRPWTVALTAVVTCAGFLVVAGPAIASPTTYFVSPSGSDSNSGTSQSLPFQHIQKCA